VDKYRKGKVKRTLRKRSEIEPEIERLQSIEDLSFARVDSVPFASWVSEFFVQAY